MKTNFKTHKNVCDSLSISTLKVLRKLHCLGLIILALMFGNIQVKGATYTAVASLTDGKSYILVAGGYAITASIPAENWIGGTDVSDDISGSTLTTTATNIVWVAKKYTNGDNITWSFKNGNKYIQNNAGNTYRNMTYNTTESKYKIASNKIYSTGAATKYLNYISDNGFRMYASNEGSYSFTFYELTESCSKSVTVSAGSNSSHGSISTITGSPVATCDATAANRTVTITISPSTGYTAPDNLSFSVTSGSAVTATKQSGPTNNVYVYSFAQNDNNSTCKVDVTCVGKQCTLIFDQNGGTGGQTSNLTATYGSAMPAISGVPTREHYTFDGYYDGAGGTGTQYYTSSGTSARNWNKNTTSNTTLYAKWTEKALTNYRTTCCTDPRLTFLDGEGDPTTTYTIVREDLASSSTAVKITCDFGSLNTSSSITWYSTRRLARSFVTPTGAYTWTSPTDQPGELSINTSEKKISAATTGVYTITLKQAGTMSGTIYCDAEATVTVTVKTVDKFIDAVNGNFSGEPQSLEDVGGGILLPTAETFTTNDACHSTTRRLVGWIKASDLDTDYRTEGRVNYIDDLKAGGKVIAPGTRVEASGVTWYAVWGEEVVAP